MTRRSSRTSRATAGRWTLTTTLSPARRVAAWTCAIEAAASGLRSTQRNLSSSGRPRSLSITWRTTRNGSAGTWSRHSLNSFTSSAGKMPSPAEMICPSLMAVGSQPLCGHPEPAGDAGPADLRRAGSPLAQRPQRHGRFSLRVTVSTRRPGGHRPGEVSAGHLGHDPGPNVRQVPPPGQGLGVVECPRRGVAVAGIEIGGHCHRRESDRCTAERHLEGQR